jgi:hypothetical protein
MISARSPGSEQNPLRPADNGISIPRLSEDEGERAGGTLELMPVDDAIYTFRAVVSRDGSVAAFEMLLSDDNGTGKGTSGTQDQAIVDAVRTARFTPAQTPLGQAVAVDMVWVFAKTTVVVPLDTPRPRPTPSDTRAKNTAKPSPQPPGVPVSGSAVPRRSATA